MRISDSLYFSVLKSEENVPVEEGFALLYDTNKSSIQNIALFSKEGDLLVSAPADKIKARGRCDEGSVVSECSDTDRKSAFFQAACTEFVCQQQGELRTCTDVEQDGAGADAYEVQDGVLLIDLKYEQLESIFKKCFPWGRRVYLSGRRSGEFNLSSAAAVDPRWD